MIDILRKIPIFSSLREEELEAIVRVLFTKRYSRDMMILLEDEEGDTLFIIMSGKVKVTSFAENGKEVIFSIMGPGDFFGDMSLLDGKPRSASVVSIDDSEICLLRREDFNRLIEDHPGIAIKLLTELTSRLRRADERIESLALLDVSGRIAGILLQLSEESGKRTPDGGVIIRSRPTHQELANMVGTSRETVTRILSQMEAKKYIVMQGKSVTILNTDILKRDLYK